MNANSSIAFERRQMNQNLDEFYRHQAGLDLSSCDDENLPTVKHQFDNNEVLRHKGGKRDLVAELNRDYNMRKGKIDDEGKIAVLPTAPVFKNNFIKRRQ